MEFLTEETKIYLLYLVKTIHLSQSFVFTIGPYITNNIYWLSLLILGYVLLITCWYLFGHCIFTPIEQYLEGNVVKYEDGSVKSFITVFFEKYLGGEKNVLYIVTFIPVINTIVSLWKINSMAIDNKNLQMQISEKI